MKDRFSLYLRCFMLKFQRGKADAFFASSPLSSVSRQLLPSFSKVFLFRKKITPWDVGRQAGNRWFFLCSVKIILYT